MKFIPRPVIKAASKARAVKTTTKVVKAKPVVKMALVNATVKAIQAKKLGKRVEEYNDLPDQNKKQDSMVGPLVDYTGRANIPRAKASQPVTKVVSNSIKTPKKGKKKMAKKKVLARRKVTPVKVAPKKTLVAEQIVQKGPEGAVVTEAVVKKEKVKGVDFPLLNGEETFEVESMSGIVEGDFEGEDDLDFGDEDFGYEMGDILSDLKKKAQLELNRAKTQAVTQLKSNISSELSKAGLKIANDPKVKALAAQKAEVAAVEGLSSKWLNLSKGKKMAVIGGAAALGLMAVYGMKKAIIK